MAQLSLPVNVFISLNPPSLNSPPHQSINKLLSLLRNFQPSQKSLQMPHGTTKWQEFDWVSGLSQRCQSEICRRSWKISVTFDWLLTGKIRWIFFTQKQFLSRDVLFPRCLWQCFGIVFWKLKVWMALPLLFFLSVHTMVHTPCTHRKKVKDTSLRFK